MWDPLVIAAACGQWEKTDLVFWTESGLRTVIDDVISGPGGAYATRKHVEKILRGEVVGEVGVELKEAAEQLAEKAKASLHRKLNAIYAAQCERLEEQLTKFVANLGELAPDQERRLDALTTRLEEVESSTEGWLEEPRLQLESLASERQKAFSDELGKISKNSASRVKALYEKAEVKLAELMDDRLHDLLIEAVHDHVTSASFQHDNLSNKKIAAAKRISLREVKRQRRHGLI